MRLLRLATCLALAACGSGSVSAANDGGAGGRTDGGTHDSASPDTMAVADGGDAGLPETGGHDAGADAGKSDAPASGYGPYASDGSDSVSVVSATVSRPGGTPFSVSLYIPSSSGLHPAVLLSSGFFQTALGYGPYAQRLASWGMVSVLRDDPGLGEASSAIASDVAYVVTTWLGAENAKPASPLHGKVDVTRVGLAGHSRGGQVALLAAEGGAKGKVKGVFGLDPVDASMAPEAVTSIASIGVPLAFVGETTDSTGLMACAPAANNYQALYGAASSPAVAITAVGADHTMFEDPAHCSFCGLCGPGTADAMTVLGYSVRYLTAFFARELLGDASVGPTFDGAGAKLDVAAGLTTLASK